MRSLAFITIGFFFAAGAALAEDQDKDQDKQDGPVRHLDAPAAAKLLAESENDEKERLTIIDIRTVAEFDEGHLKGAKQIDFLRDDFAEEIAKLDRKKPYLVHCRSGGRSTRSLSVWKELGFEKVYHLDGGILAWIKAKLPVEK